MKNDRKKFYNNLKKAGQKTMKSWKKIFFKLWKMHLGQKENKQKFRDPYKSLVPG